MPTVHAAALVRPAPTLTTPNRFDQVSGELRATYGGVPTELTELGIPQEKACAACAAYRLSLKTESPREEVFAMVKEGCRFTPHELAELWIDQHPFGDAVVISNHFDTDWVVNDQTVGIAFNENNVFASQFKGINKRYVLVIIEGSPVWCSLPTEVWVVFEELTRGFGSMLVHTEKVD